MRVPIDRVAPTLSRLGRPRPTQDSLVHLLDKSPLPWTRTMLDDWFCKVMAPYLLSACSNGRVWRIEYGIYTVRRRYGLVHRVVTDEMIKRYTGIAL